MDALISFKNGSHLFKCDPDDFTVVIKDTLTNILIRDMTRDGRFCVSNMIKKVKCIICWQHEFDDSSFIICKECCKLCVNADIIIAMNMHTYVCNKRNDGYWFDMSGNFGILRATEHYHNKSELLKYFIDHSHGLIHRFYHTVPILFLLSLCDPNSDCNVLNRDVIFYIFGLIY